jgi:hypothetical protein
MSFTKFAYLNEVIVIKGFYRGIIRTIVGTRKILWFEREYRFSKYVGLPKWFKESYLEKTNDTSN